MAAAYSLMKAQGLKSPPGTVTGELTVRFLRPTPIGKRLHLRAWPTKIDDGKVAVEGSLEVDGVKTVAMRGIYFAVKEGHPGFDKWH
jgi:acyl dehydratase